MFEFLRGKLAGGFRVMANAVQPTYPSTGKGRRASRWRGFTSAGPNAVGASTIPELRRQSRQAVRENWAAGRASELLTTHVIGTGIKPQSLCPDAGFREAAHQLWWEWVDQADADGLLDFYGIQELAFRSMLEGGDSFVRFRPRRPGDGLIVPLQLQCLEAEQCPVEHDQSGPGNPVWQGIERDGIGRRAAYWMYREHPGECVPGAVNVTDLVRIPASEVMHICQPTRPGQLRGVPHLARMLATLSDIADYEDAERVRKKLATLKMGVITRPSDSSGPVLGEGDADPGGVADASMEPGTMLVLEDGEDVKFFDPVDVGTNYGEFLRWQYRGVAASVGVLYEELTGDVEKTNDRLWRAQFNTFKRRARILQHNIVAVQLCRPTWSRFIDMALLSGALRRPAGLSDTDLKRVAWTPDRHAYIHPVQDVQALREEIAAGLTSRARAVSDRGDDVEEIDRQRAADAAREKQLGMSPEQPAPTANPRNTGEDEE